jgi:hypothetical protein
MNIDKETIQKAVDEALEKVLEMQDKIENSEDIVDSTDLEEMIEEDEDSVKDIGTESAPTNEKVEEKVEDAIKEEPNYNFLGLEITINSNGDKYDVTIKKDDKEKTESVDSADLPAILGLVEDFFNELVLDEDSVAAEDEITDEEEEVEENEEEEVEENEEEDEEDEEDEESDLIHPNVTMSSLRRRYKDKINEVFEHGLLAKELALGMVKEKLVAGTVKELIDKTKEKDAIIASKMKELKRVSLKYLIAKKMDNQYKKVYGILSSGIEDVKKSLTENKIDADTANKALNHYRIIISKVVEANKPETIIAAIEKTDKINKAILANANKEKTEQTKAVVSNKSQNNVTKKEIKNVVKPVNVLNRTGWKNNSTILASRHDGIEEMSAEILRIAGIEEE